VALTPITAWTTTVLGLRLAVRVAVFCSRGIQLDYLEKSYGGTKRIRRQLTQTEETLLTVALFASEGVVAPAVCLSAKTSKVRSQLLAILSHAYFARAEVGRSCVPWLQNLTQWLSWPLDN